MEVSKVNLALAVCLGRSQAASRLLCDTDSSPGEAPKGDEGHLQNIVRLSAKLQIIFETLTLGCKDNYLHEQKSRTGKLNDLKYREFL